MTVFAYYTPEVSSPINDRRGGTIRVGSNAPDQIRIYRGWDTTLYFAFRDHYQQPYFVTGRTITARIYNTSQVELWSSSLRAVSKHDGSAELLLSGNDTQALQPGLYNLVIEYETDNGRVELAHTARNIPRYVIEVVDIKNI